MVPRALRYPEEDRAVVESVGVVMDEEVEHDR